MSKPVSLEHEPPSIYSTTETDSGDIPEEERLHNLEWEDSEDGGAVSLGTSGVFYGVRRDISSTSNFWAIHHKLVFACASSKEKAKARCEHVEHKDLERIKAKIAAKS